MRLIFLDKKVDFFGPENKTGPVTASRVGVKTGLAVYLAELEQQNLFIAIGQFLGPVTKR